MYVNAKANCNAEVQAEDAHQAALAALSEEFASEIDEAYAVAKIETEKKLEAKSFCILADREHMKSLEKERTRHNEKWIRNVQDNVPLSPIHTNNGLKPLPATSPPKGKLQRKIRRRREKKCERSWKWWSVR